MILTHLMGGVGNQMFQYAAGRSLALRLGMPLKLYFDDHYKLATRKFALDHFQIDTLEPTKQELSDYLPDGGVVRRIKKVLHKPYTGKLFRDHVLFELNKAFFEINEGVFLSGFWQNVGYFQSNESLLRKELAFKVPVEGMNKEKCSEIATREIPVSIHVRRSDYMNPASEMYPLDLDYYQRAVHALEDNLTGEPFYYVFTDDADWVLQNFPSLLGSRFELVTHNANAAHEDLRLMSVCHHHIIANSSFSWWGAWLNARPDKVIVGPKVWMKGVSIIEQALFAKKDILV